MQFKLIDLSKRSQQSGIFVIAPDQEGVNGTLTLAGQNTSLYVWSEDLPDISSETSITGILDDRQKVSLIGCNIRSQGHAGRHDQVVRKTILSPHCVIFGDRHFSDKEEVVCQISFSLEHAAALFHDTDAYGTIFNNSEAIDRLARIDNPSRSISLGEWNWISYYTGKKTIFSSDTEIGQVSAEHAPVFSVGIAANSGLTKKAYVSIKFDAPLTVTNALYRMGRVLQFLDIVVGYRQNVSEISIYTGYDHTSHFADVYSTSYSEHHPSHHEGEPSFQAILINPVHNVENLSSVLRAWLKRDDKWYTARMRLSGNWGNQIYNYDRIIAAANVFDLLPREVYGDSTRLPQDLDDAITQAQKIFRELPESDKRDGILGYLGSVGGWSLKKRIRHRATRITDVIDELLPDIETVIDEAVNLRNFYVHGTPSRVSNNEPLQLLSFLTKSLEFIFFASDLLDAGWDIGEWCQKPKPLEHPFHDYLAYYQEDLSKLKVVIE